MIRNNEDNAQSLTRRCFNRPQQIFFIFFYLIFCVVCNIPFAVDADAQVSLEKLTFSQCKVLAIEASEKLLRSEQEILAFEAQYQQAIAQLFPEITLLANQRIRSSDDFGSVSGGDSSEEGTGSDPDENRRGRSLGRTQLEASVAVRQPIFAGFRELIIARAKAAEKEAAKFSKQREEELLILNVAEAFFQVLLYESDLRVMDKSEQVLNERLDELRQFLTLGKSREGELLAAQSELADLKVSRETIKGLRGASRELLAFLINKPSSSFDIIDEKTAIPIGSIDQYLERARQRADLLAAEQQVTAQENVVLASERESWPVISLEGNTYPYEDPDRNRDWDVFFLFDVPIFDSGRRDARTAEERAQAGAIKYSAREKARTIEREVRVAWNNYQASSAEVETLSELLKVSKRNFQSQKQDYSNGVVTNLDVLAAIRTMQEAERRLSAAELTLRFEYHKLEVSAGGV